MFLLLFALKLRFHDRCAGRHRGVSQPPAAPCERTRNARRIQRRVGADALSRRVSGSCSSQDAAEADIGGGCPAAVSKAVPPGALKGKFQRVEATPGIEPGCADLQSAASPLRHVALMTAGACITGASRVAMACQRFAPSTICGDWLQGGGDRRPWPSRRRLVKVLRRVGLSPRALYRQIVSNRKL
jgi:hypothetical protein